jgi:glycosyltransferase involved in cell wall biosynthesis
MRVLWHSKAAPWEPTGYGQQTAIWAPWLAGQGHQVVISVDHGINSMTAEWQGLTVLPAQLSPGGSSLLPYYAAEHRADLIILLSDFWTYNPALIRELPKVAAWIPVDTDPLSVLDYAALARSGAVPVAMSEHGRRMLAKAGADDPLMVPHGIDCGVFAPPADREALRLGFGLTDEFAVGINANNIDPFRKALPQQMAAFARFHVKRPRSVLYVHSTVRVQDSLDLEMIAVTLGIRDAVRFADQDRMQQGTFSQADMAAWYGALDVLMNATMGEGFGLPGVEAQACGTPAILSRNSTGPELAGRAGALVPCDPFWNHAHQSWWGCPAAKGLDVALAAAFAARAHPARRAAARVNALRYSIEAVAPLWTAALERLA